MGEFAKRANEVMDDWKGRLEAQRAQLEKHIPSSRSVALQKAMANIAALRDQSFQTGYGLRSQALEPRNNELLSDLQRIGMPGREVMIDLPATRPQQKQANVVLRSLLNTTRTTAEDARMALKRLADEKMQRGIRVTDDPSTLPWYYPAMTMAAPTSFVQGYQKADSDLDSNMNSHMDKQVEDARTQFESALQTEYDNRPFKKASCAAELIAGLAHAHVKVADGELNQAAGLYGSLAALLGTGGYVAGRRFAESNDPRQQRLKALKDTIYQRMSNKPLPVLVSSAPLPPDQNIEFKDNMSLPAPGELVPKEASATRREKKTKTEAPPEEPEPALSKEQLAGGGLLAAGTGLGAAGYATRNVAKAAKGMHEAASLAEQARKGTLRKSDAFAQLTGHYVEGGHDMLNAPFMGSTPGRIANKVVDAGESLRGKIKKVTGKDVSFLPRRDSFGATHLREFGNSYESALRMAASEGNRNHLPVDPVVNDFKRLSYELGDPRKALHELHKLPQHHDILRSAGRDKGISPSSSPLFGGRINMAKKYSRLGKRLGALPYVGGAAALAGGGLLAKHYYDLKHQPEEA